MGIMVMAVGWRWRGEGEGALRARKGLVLVRYRKVLREMGKVLDAKK